MAVTYDKDHIGVDENHDLKRELAFYEQAKYACKVGSEKLLELGVPLVRPKDYFAEMVKTDEHMEYVVLFCFVLFFFCFLSFFFFRHIRSRLAKQKVRLQMIEQKKRNNEQRKFGKGKQMQARLEKEKEKAAQASEARSLQKKRKQYGGASDVDNNQDDDDEGPKKKTRKELPESVQYGKQGRTNYKRVHKDAKFGKGSRKKGGWKQNDADSTYTSRDDFNPRQNRAPFGSKAGKRSQGGGKKPSSSKNRPGKERRLKKTLGKK